MDDHLDAVQVDFAAQRPGFSFLAHPAEKFHESLRAMNRLAILGGGPFQKSEEGLQSRSSIRIEATLSVLRAIS